MRIIVSIALACLLSACARQSQVQLYPGAELPASQVLTVQVPTELEITDLNGREVPSVNSLFSGDKRILKLEPGEYRINAFFKNVYDIGGGISTEVVRTSSAIFTVDGEAGETWRLGYSAPKSLEEAQQMKDSFTGWSENLATGERIATQAGAKSQSPLGQLLGGAAVPPTAATAIAPLGAPQTSPVSSDVAVAPAAPASKATLPHNEATLATLQQLWQLLTPESKADFLEWAKE